MTSYLTIYTTSTIDDTRDVSTEFCVGGSYVSRGRAVDELTDWLMLRMTLREDIAHAFADDVNHHEMHGAVEWANDELVYKKPETEIREYVRDVIDSEGCYYIYNEDWDDTFHFNLDENDLVLADGEDVADAIKQINN